MKFHAIQGFPCRVRTLLYHELTRYLVQILFCLLVVWVRYMGEEAEHDLRMERKGDDDDQVVVSLRERHSE